MAKSNSGVDSATLSERFHDYYHHLRMQLQGDGTAPNYDWIFNDLDSLDAHLRKRAGLPIEKAKTLEIGYGQRPYRLKALLARGVDAYGVDLDAPMLRGSLSELTRTFRKNGFERFLKTSARYALFDRAENRHFAAALRAKGYNHPIPADRFLVGDAGGEEMRKHFKPGSLDLIHSAEVFEHIPAESLKALLKHAAEWISPKGILAIRPNPFPSITGGHLPEWYRGQLYSQEPKATEPWEHLRKKRTQANTYLNKLRMADYEALFGEHFKILERTVVSAGQPFLTPAIRAELPEFSEEDLVSDFVEWTLAPK
jgi:hypothetical protein